MASASKSIGGISIFISANIEKFRKNLTVARRLLTSFTSSVKRAIFSLKGLAVAFAAGFALRGLGKAFSTLDTLADSADKLGLTTGKLAGFRLAADQAGVSTEQLERALVMLSTKTGKRADVALFELIDKSSKLRTEQERLALATKMFGSRAAGMVNVLRMTRPELEALVKFTNDVGYGMSRTVAAGVGRAVDAFGKLKVAIAGVVFSVVAELAPFVEALSNSLTKFLATGGKAKGIGSGIADAIIATTKLVADAIQRMVLGVRGFLLDAQATLMSIGGNLKHVLGIQGARGMNALEFRRHHEARKALAVDKQAPAWSATIGNLVGKARAGAAAQAKKSPSLTPTGSFSSLMQSIGGRMIQQQLGPLKTAMMGMAAPLLASLKLQAMAAGGSGATRSMTPGFAFAESGSADSYRQQAAIRRQGDTIQKKTLKVNENMLAELRKQNKGAIILAEAGFK